MQESKLPLDNATNKEYLELGSILLIFLMKTTQSKIPGDRSASISVELDLNTVRRKFVKLMSLR
jgi:hypothetical protein